MAHLKFSLTSQCNKTTILLIVFMNDKKLTGLVSSNNQSYAGSRKLGMNREDSRAYCRLQTTLKQLAFSR